MPCSRKSLGPHLYRASSRADARLFSYAEGKGRSSGKPPIQCVGIVTNEPATTRFFISPGVNDRCEKSSYECSRQKYQRPVEQVLQERQFDTRKKPTADLGCREGATPLDLSDTIPLPITPKTRQPLQPKARYT